MRRGAGWLAIWVVCVWGTGCFSGGEIVDEHGDAGRLEEGCEEGELACGSQCIEESLVPDEGCEAGCEPSNGGVEICDGLDNNCDGQIDEDFRAGACTVGEGACEVSGEYECVDEQTAECNVAPADPQPELCGDGIDNDCDGQIDEDDARDAATWYADRDGDGFGDPDDAVSRCTQPAAYLEQGGDCDDANAQVHPDAEEVCGDGIDNDCDGKADDASAVDALTWYVDCDGDGFAADSSGARDGCDEPASPEQCSNSLAGWTDKRPGTSNTDCNDDQPQAFPGQRDYFETPMDGADFNEQWDYDCDGVVDRRWTSTGGSCDWNCNGSSGWKNDFYPSCGVSAEYVSCPPFQCSSGAETRTQKCH